MMYFEVTLTYYAEDPDSTSARVKKYVDVIGVSAVNYTDAESQATKWGENSIEGEFHISPIKELAIEDVYPNKLDQTWFMCKCVFLTTNDCTDKVKENKIAFLVEAADSVEATKRAKEILDGNFDCETRVVQVTETKIKEFI